MTFETAFRLKDSNAVRKTEKAVLSLAEGGLLIRGADILTGVERELSLPVNSGLLYDLISGGVIVSRHPSRNIEDYLFELNLDVAGEFFQRESFAAEVVQQYEMRRSSTKPLGISYAATVPIEFPNAAEGFEEIEPALIRLVTEAERDLWIVNPFFDEYGAQRLLPSMIGAAKSGVKIWILGRQLGRASGPGPNAAVRDVASMFIQEELAPRLEIRDFYRQDEQGHQLYALHTKMMIADESIAYIGSANLTRHCLRSNFELGVILRGEGVRPLTDLTRSLWCEAESIDLKELADL